MSGPYAHRRSSAFAVCLAIVVVLTTVLLAVKGWSFYRLPISDRVEHADFQDLRPSGLWGNGYGWVAAMLMVLNLAYLVRRRLASTRFGSMAAWLDIHVFTGMLIAALVSFHSAFQLRTPIAATSTISLGMVFVTGLVGRFLHALIPAGTRERLVAAIDAIEQELPGTRDDLVAAIVKRPGPAVPADASLIRSIAAIPSWRRAARDRVRALGWCLPRRKKMNPRLRKASKVLLQMAAADARSAGVNALLRSWRGMHRFFAILMVIAVLLHALVAWHYGYRWIFES